MHIEVVDKECNCLHITNSWKGPNKGTERPITCLHFPRFSIPVRANT